MIAFLYDFGIKVATIVIDTATLHLHKPYEPRHEISNNVVCAASKGSDQPAHTHSLIRAFCWLLEYSMNINLLTGHYLEFLSLKGGYTGS